MPLNNPCSLSLYFLYELFNRTVHNVIYLNIFYILSEITVTTPKDPNPKVPNPQGPYPKALPQGPPPYSPYQKAPTPEGRYSQIKTVEDQVEDRSG